jgi:uncharacterized protein HemX
MSSREKKLLSLLLLAGFLLLNLFLYSQYQQKKALFETALETSQIELEQAKTSQDNATQYAEEMQWLADHEPAQTDAQTVQGQLQALKRKRKQPDLPSSPKNSSPRIPQVNTTTALRSKSASRAGRNLFIAGSIQ